MSDQYQPYPGGAQQPSGYPGGAQQPYSGGAQQPSGYPGGPGGYPSHPNYPGGVSSQMPPAAPSQPRKKSNALKIILIVLAVLLVLCAGGAAVTFFLLRDEVAVATDTRVSAPETLAGRPKVSDPSLESVSQQMATELQGELPDATSTASAFYGDITTGDLVMVVAVSGLVADPGGELDASFSSMSASGLPVTNITDVDPGPLGGEAKCGDGTVEGLSVGVCGWADRGSLGMIVLYNASGADAGADFVQMRGEIEQQG